MDDYSDIVIADQSSRFQKTPNGIVGTASAGQHPRYTVTSRRRGRNLQMQATRHRENPTASVSTGSNSTRTRSTMEEDIVRLHPERFGNQPRPSRQEQQQQQHRPLPKEVLALEAMIRRPKPANAHVQTEKIRLHRNTEVHLGNGPFPSSGSRRKQPNKTSKPKPQKHNVKPKNKTMSKIKLLNCFGSSSSSNNTNRHHHDDEDARRQRAVIQEHYGRVVSKSNSKDFHCFDDDHYGEGNSLAASMSVITVGSSSRDSGKQHQQLNPIVRRGRSSTSNGSTARDILDELQEREEELISSHSTNENDRGRSSVLNRSMEEKFHKIETVPKSIPKNTPAVSRIHRPPQRTNKTPHHQQQPNPLRKTISATTSVVQGVVTPPRGAVVSTSWMAKPSSNRPAGLPMTIYQADAPSVTYHSVGTESFTMNTSASQTTVSVVNLAKQQQTRILKQQQQQTASPPFQKDLPLPKTIGPRCHFCGGPHWIYNCPNMDEKSSEGRRRRRRKTQTSTTSTMDDPDTSSSGGADDEGSSSSTTTSTSDDGDCGLSNNNDDLDTTMDYSTTSSMVGGVCWNQSHRLLCQPCFNLRR